MLLALLQIAAIVVTPVDPFVKRLEGPNSTVLYDGYDIEFMERVMTEMGQPMPPMIEVPSIPDGLSIVRNSTDLVFISSVTINSARERTIDFSTRYFTR